MTTRPVDRGDTTRPIAIVGLVGGQWFGRDAEAALRRANVLIGHARQFALLPADIPGERVELWGDIDAVIARAVETREAGGSACILSDGDPGYYGMLRQAIARLGEGAVAVHPAPSAVALACARAGIPWDDAVVVSLHGGTLDAAVAAAAAHPTVVVLVSKARPAAAVGRALADAGIDDRLVVVCSRLGEAEAESVVFTDVAGLAAGAFDPLSVVILRRP
jgi:precorrin-6B C5,15-methyltransferase / cobalt-precorrin-6B C5,C15-methyltransferase